MTAIEDRPSPGLRPYRAAYDSLVCARLLVHLASMPRTGRKVGELLTTAPATGMRLRPFSDHRRGLFVTIDGPSGAGKSTTVAHLAQLLTATGEQVHVTAEPSAGPIGKLAREVTDTLAGPAPACLYAADRYHHLDTDIRPRLESGELVICDRYVPSGLVMQRFDGVDPAFLWDLNSAADRPDLAVILEAGGYHTALWVCGLTLLTGLPITFLLIRRTDTTQTTALQS